MAQLPTELPALLLVARGGDHAAAAELLARLGRKGSERLELLRALQPWSAGAHSIAFLGSAGAGKSTLMVEVARVLAAGGRRLGFVAGGASSAVLAEKPRYELLQDLPSVCLHAVGAGVPSLEAALAADVLAHLGCDPVLLELGSGRRGFPRLQWAQSLVLILSPGGPDAAALAAAGILGAADLVVVNKADREGAAEFRRALGEELSRLGRTTHVLTSVAYRGEGVAELAAALLELGDRARASDAERALREQASARLRVQELVADELHDRLENDPRLGAELERAAAALRQGSVDLVTATQQAVARVLREG
jgi:LAO/AO transport system kinase